MYTYTNTKIFNDFRFLRLRLNGREWYRFPLIDTKASHIDENTCCPWALSGLLSEKCICLHIIHFYLYIVTLLVISAYSIKLEPMSNQLQEVNMNIKALHDHVNKLTDVLQFQRDNASIEFVVIFKKAQKIKPHDLPHEHAHVRVSASADSGIGHTKAVVGPMFFE